jgi:hypothetical protein
MEGETFSYEHRRVKFQKIQCAVIRDNLNVLELERKRFIVFDGSNSPRYPHPPISIAALFYDHKDGCCRKGLKETEACPVEYGRDKHIILPPHNQSKYFIISTEYRSTGNEGVWDCNRHMFMW